MKYVKNILKLNNKINTKAFGLSEQIFFSQRLSLLLDSGISMVEALKMMENIENSSHRKVIYQSLIKDIEAGITLSRSISGIKLNINDLLFSLIQNGEMNGRLPETLLQAHSYLEKKDEMKKKIISSLIYPGFIVIATICMTLFLILYIFPKIIPLLESLNIKLPLMTQIVQWLYYTMTAYGLWMLLGVVIIFIISRLILQKSYFLRYKFHSLILITPVIGKYFKIYTLSTICTIGEMLLSSGKGIPEVIAFARDSSKNEVYKKIFMEIYNDSMHGVSLTTSLKKNYKLFPPILLDMIAIGERTGNLGLMLNHSSRIFEQEINNVLKRFSTLIEPILMIFMGLVVGSVALSIILPVYEITNHLSK
jgi:type IV pilus assembly protein PilC